MTGDEGREAVRAASSPPTTESAPEGARRSGRYDAMARRRSKRTGREKGCWLYIPAEQLDKTGHGGDSPAPFYRVWGAPRGRLTIQLYKEG